MCKYCKEFSDIYHIVHGEYFDIIPTFGFKNDTKYDAWINQNSGDKKAAIMITTDNSNGVFFEINYCPICGRKL